MRFVIYDDETMEPITVISLPGIAERDIMEHMNGRIRVPLPNFLSTPRFIKDVPANAPVKQRIQTVDLRFERLQRGDQQSLMCFTREAELALLLNPDFLPGQRKAVGELQSQNEHLANLLIQVISGRA